MANTPRGESNPAPLPVGHCLHEEASGRGSLGWAREGGPRQCPPRKLWWVGDLVAGKAWACRGRALTERFCENGRDHLSFEQ